MFSSHALLKVIFSFYLCLYVHFGLQICEEEFTYTGIRVKWKKTVPANNVKSDPPCYNNKKLITRNCVGTKWEPPANELDRCLQIVNYYNLSACPPGFDMISKTNTKHCYRINKASSWNYPCLKSGGAMVITDLNNDDVLSLLHSLKVKNISKFFWLPAKRPNFFSPIVSWYIPGPKWGHPVESNNILDIRTTKLKNCLLLDIQRQLLTTEACSDKHPSLCFYINDIHYPAMCPPKYHAVRYMPDEGVCLGIEESGTNLTYNDFIDNKICNASLGKKNDHLTRFIFKKIAEVSNLPDDQWCWFDSFNFSQKQYARSFNFTLPEIYISINKEGSLGLQAPSTSLPCMACLSEVIYRETELLFEYDEKDQVMYLTVYYPSGLWKYSDYDRGIQCFSDVKGFAKVIDINDLTIIELESDQHNVTNEVVEKKVYQINVTNDRAAQYWCEGHTSNFSLIRTNKIVVNPRGDEVHVFALVISVYFCLEDIEDIEVDMILSELCSNITKIFSAKKVLIMEYLNYESNYLTLLLHLHIAVENIYEDNSKNIQRIFNITLNAAVTILQKYDYKFVNLSSSLYCLPTTSFDNKNVLDWELTPIGHIAAPKQFCLQENGLPVKRLCNGSYQSGSNWGDVEGKCNYNYQPSDTTTFLYNFVKGQVDENYTSQFLTYGLSFVLRDVDKIIPADIYYLSMSLQHILKIVQGNDTSIDMGNIENIAWVMNRVMVLNCNYLRLAQTLNSTNVILDSINNIIEILVHKNGKVIDKIRKYTNANYYQLAVQPQFILQVSYPSIDNISGIALIKPSPENDLFTEMIIKPLYINTTLEEVMTIENLEVAAWIPDAVLRSLRKITNETNADDNNKMHIIISVFHNDAIFQELKTNEYSVNSRIIGVSVPGYLTNFIELLPLIYRDFNSTYSEIICGYWNFQPHSDGHVPGFWSNSGCYLKKSEKSLTVCECDHLTHFGQLLNIGRNRSNTRYSADKHIKSLNIISLVGSFLSLLGIMGIWITASVFHTWRNKASTKILLHLSTSIALPLIFMIVFNLDNTVFEEINGVVSVPHNLRAVCISLGALLHYSVLASFMWMLITAILQFIRYVRVLGVYRPSRFMIKFTLIGWGTPLIPVIIVLALDRENYIPNASLVGEPNTLICYPSGFYLIITVIVPICMILSINITLFVAVIYAISKGPDGKMRRADIDLIGSQLRLSIFLFFLLGLTWIFGVLSFSNNPLWSYFFCLTSTIQGFVLFVYFIICDAQTRNLWITLMKPQFQIESSRKSITSISSNLS